MRERASTLSIGNSRFASTPPANGAWSMKPEHERSRQNKDVRQHNIYRADTKLL